MTSIDYNLSTNQDLIIEEELIEDFMNLDDEENKLITYLKDEFQTDFTFFNYGKIVYIQQQESLEANSFPHISELLENYEKIYSTTCYTGYMVLKQRKCKEIIYNIIYITIFFSLYLFQ